MNLQPSPLSDVVEVAQKLSDNDRAVLQHHLNNALAIAVTNMAFLDDSLPHQNMETEVKEEIGEIVNDARHGLHRLVELCAILTSGKKPVK